jgi:hypothetical protein
MLVRKSPAAILNAYQRVVMKELSNVSKRNLSVLNVPYFTKKGVEKPTHLKIACCCYAKSSAYKARTPNPELKKEPNTGVTFNHITQNYRTWAVVNFGNNR